MLLSRFARFLFSAPPLIALLLGISPRAAAQASPAIPLGAGARPVPERTAVNHTTWDLGPDPQRPGQHRFAVAIRPAPAAPAAVSSSTTQTGKYGGYQCNTGVGGTASNGNPFTDVYVGEYYLFGNPRYTCNGYIQWDVNSALPSFSTVTGVWLYPIILNSKTGGATLNVHVEDVANTMPIPYANVYDGAIWNDFNAMSGGHAEYGNFSVDLADATMGYNLELSHQAVMDAINRLRATGYGNFTAAFRADPVAAGNFLTFDTGSSTLWLYYSEYVASQIAINHIQVDYPLYSQKAVIELYNYDYGIDLSGWTLRSAGWSGLETWTIPGGVYIPRHSRLLIIDGAGANTSDQLYTGGNKFHWGKNLAPYDVQLTLQRPDASGADYVCWGNAAPAPPANTGWTGGCPGGLFYYDTLERTRDSDTDSAADWSFGFVDMSVNLMPGQSGTRRRSDVFLNEVLVYGPGGYNWLEIANYGPPVNLQGWKVQVYSDQSPYGTLDGTYTFPSNPVQPGEVVWLAEGSYFGGGNPPVDNLHRNLGFTVNWNQLPNAGEIILRDAGGEARDYIVFGAPRNLHLPPELSWNGPFIPLSGATPDIARAADLNTNSAGEWVQRPDLSNWGALTPTQQGAGRVQDEVGGYQYHFNLSSAGNAAFGAGSVVNVTRQVGLEEFAIPAAPVSGPRGGLLVVKRQGSGSVYYSQPVAVNNPGQSVVRTGLIAPPLVLDPGAYAFMLYLDGDWQTSQDFYQFEYLSFGTPAGYTYEDGFTPAPSFLTPSGGDTLWAAHTWLSTIAPPAISSTPYPPDGEETVPYSFAHTSSGGYGASRTWSITAGALPDSLSMDAAGVISGTASQDGIYTFTVRVTDGAGLWSERSETITIQPRLEVATSALPAYDRATAPYSYSLIAYGGVAPYTWSCAGVLTCNAAGTLGGTTAAASGNYPINVQVTDSAGLVASKILNLTVYNVPTILTGTLANGYVGIDYGTQRLSGAGGTGPGGWSVTGGGLPPGLALAGNAITGIPTTSGSYPVTITYTVGAESDSNNYTISITTASVPPYWIRRGLAGGDIGKLYFSPNFALDGTVIAVSGDRESLYIAQDGGFFWKPMNLALEPAYDDNQLYDNHVNMVAFDPAFDGRPAGVNHTIAVATDVSGLLVSDDLDVTWTQRITGLSPDPYPGPFVNVKSVMFYAGTSAAYCVAYNQAAGKSILYKSSAGLDNWNALANTGLPASGIDKVYMSPDFVNDRTFFAPVGHIGLYRTRDGGEHWQTIGGGLLNTNDATSFELSPNYGADNTLAMTASPNGFGNIYVSHDNGFSFTPRGSIYSVREFHFPPDYNAATNQKIFASGDTAGGLQMMVSTDDGYTFSPTGTGGLAPANFSGSFFISPNFAADGNLFATGRNGVGIVRSEDRGSLWGPSDNGIYFQNINTAAYAPDYFTSGKAFVATDNGGYFTVNRGRIWQTASYNAPLPATLRIKSIAVSPNFATDNKVFAFACGPASCQTIGSSDGGRTYSALAAAGSEIYHPNMFQISPNFATDNRLFYTGYNGALSIFSFYLSSDAGATFTAQNTATVRGAGLFGVSPGYVSDASVYLNDYAPASQTYVNRLSTTGGASFSPFTAPTGNFGAVFPRTYNRLTGSDGTHSHTFFWNCQKTVNAGASFTPLPSAGCGDMWLSPNYQFDNTLFVFHIDYSGFTTGLYKSTDGGASFSLLSAYGNPRLFSTTNFVALSPGYAGDQTLLVATARGLFISTDGGFSFALSTGTEGISKQVTAVVQDPNTPGRLYIGTGDVGVLRSNDDGLTATDITGSLPPTYPINGLLAVGNPTVLLAAMATGVYRFTEAAGDWTLVSVNPNNGGYQGFTTDAAAIYAARNDGSGPSISSPLGVPNAQLGVTWTALDPSLADASAIDYNGSLGLTLGKGGIVKGLRSGAAAVNTASLWSASASSGARYSTNSGATWIAAPGTGDYTLPPGSSWQTVRALGLNAASGSREVLIGHSSAGLFKSADGGTVWRSVSGPGSGLEATSRNVSALLSVVNTYGVTDVLVGVNGSTLGGVYLSGDGGEHWTQINQGFDPGNLNIATLAKTSCSGCPVQYYSGTYGSGVYTRTIPVVPAPAITGWCFGGTGCTCATAPGSGPQQGGQPFRLCGTGFAASARVEFDGLPATGCVFVSSSVYTCTATPQHFALGPGGSAVAIRLRNLDTRTGYASQPYTYGPGGDRVSDLVVTKAGGGGTDAALQWSCTGCNITPAKIYRSQSAGFSLFESYTSVAETSWTQTGALSGGSPTYFWVVE